MPVAAALRNGGEGARMSAHLLLVLFGVAMALLVAAAIVWQYVSYRGRRVVMCPETHEPVDVELDAWRAARERTLDVEAKLKLQSCSRWPEKEDCGQECIAQIDESPEGTLMRNILVSWFRWKACALCGHAIGPIQWHDQMPGLRAPDGKLREWEGVAAADLPAILATHHAVCWNCLLAESFRRDHPALVTDRAPTPLRDKLYH